MHLETQIRKICHDEIIRLKNPALEVEKPDGSVQRMTALQALAAVTVVNSVPIEVYQALVDACISGETETGWLDEESCFRFTEITTSAREKLGMQNAPLTAVTPAAMSREE